MTVPYGEYPDQKAEAEVAYRLGVRVVDHQIRLVSAEHAKIESLIRLGVAIMAGKLVVAGFMLNASVRPDTTAGTLIAMGMMSDVLGVFGLFWSTIFGARETRAMVGVDVLTLRNQMAAAPRGPGLAASALDGLARAYGRNERLLAAIAKARAVAGVWLGAGLAAHLISGAYIVGGTLNV